MLHKSNVAMGQVRLQDGSVLPILAAPADLPELLERMEPLPDMRMLALGLLQTHYKSLC